DRTNFVWASLMGILDGGGWRRFNAPDRIPKQLEIRSPKSAPGHRPSRSAHPKDLLFTKSEAAQSVLSLLSQTIADGRLRGRDGATILDEIAKMTISTHGNRHFQRNR